MRRKKKSIKKTLSITIVLLMILAMMPTTVLSMTISDTESHWAKDTINKWMDEGLLNGYPDGTFRPNHSITRAELMVLINKSFNFVEEAPIDYIDIGDGAWYKSTVAKTKAAGYMGGYPDGSMRPENPISRQEVAVVILKIKGLMENQDAIAAFKDKEAIASWSKGAVGAVVEAGYMGGYPDCTFKPTENITRAEALVVLSKVIPTEKVALEIVRVFDKAGIYGVEHDVVSGQVK